MDDLANPFDLYQDENGRFVKIEKENFVFYFMEKNGFVNKDSYETEVYIYEEDETNFKKLHFANRQENIVNDLLVETKEINIEITQDNVEYYLDLLLDEEIPDEEICVGLNKLKESNIYLDLDFVNIYASTIGDVEECD